MALSHGGGIQFVRDRKSEKSPDSGSDRHYAAYTLDGPLAGATLTVRLETEDHMREREAQVPAAIPVLSKEAEIQVDSTFRQAQVQSGPILSDDVDDAIAEEIRFQQVRLYDRIVEPDSLRQEPLEPDFLDQVGDALTEFIADPVAGPVAATPSIPAAYTYFGQFLAHDMTWMQVDTENDLAGIGSGEPVWVNGRHGHALSFDTLFGAGPETGPRTSVWRELAGASLGEAVGDDDLDPDHLDLPRAGAGLSCTTDLRADTNLALAQMHVLLVRFHHRMHELTNGNDTLVRERTIRHLQAVVLTDYLKKIIPETIYCDVLTSGRKIVATDDTAPDFSFEVPVEFAAACMRFGHSMISRTYRNWIVKYPPGSILSPAPGSLGNIFHYTQSGGGLEHGQLEVHWAQYWRHMVEGTAPALPPAVNAEPIGAAMAPELEQLETARFPPVGLDDGMPTFSLARRTLRRGEALGLPSGQDLFDVIALATGGTVGNWLDVGQFLAQRPARFASLAANPTFCTATPLWFYALAEAEDAQQGQLGPVAGRVVMETFHAALQYAQTSIISVDAAGKTINAFQREVRTGIGDACGFTLTDVVAIAYGHVDN